MQAVAAKVCACRIRRIAGADQGVPVRQFDTVAKGDGELLKHLLGLQLGGFIE
jgi:hypothetical protein